MSRRVLGRIAGKYASSHPSTGFTLFLALLLAAKSEILLPAVIRGSSEGFLNRLFNGSPLVFLALSLVLWGVFQVLVRLPSLIITTYALASLLMTLEAMFFVAFERFIAPWEGLRLMMMGTAGFDYGLVEFVRTHPLGLFGIADLPIIFLGAWMVRRKTGLSRVIWQAAVLALSISGLWVIGDRSERFTTWGTTAKLVQKFGFSPYVMKNVQGMVAQRTTALNQADFQQSIFFLQSAQPVPFPRPKRIVMMLLEATQAFTVSLEAGTADDVHPFLRRLYHSPDALAYDALSPRFLGDTEYVEYTVFSGIFQSDIEFPFMNISQVANLKELLPVRLKNLGYQFRPYHGGEPDFYDRSRVFHLFGADAYITSQDLNCPLADRYNKRYCGDVSMFLRVAEAMETQTDSTFTYIIGLSTHFPFSAQLGEEMVPFTGDEKIDHYLAAQRYQDRALKTFFEALEQKNLMDDTLFILFGDHGGVSSEEEYRKLFGDPPSEEAVVRWKFSVPLIFYSRGSGWALNRSPNFATLADVKPTLLALLGDREPFLGSGKSLFQEERRYAATTENVLLSDEGTVPPCIEALWLREPRVFLRRLDLAAGKLLERALALDSWEAVIREDGNTTIAEWTCPSGVMDLTGYWVGVRLESSGCRGQDGEVLSFLDDSGRSAPLKSFQAYSGLVGIVQGLTDPGGPDPRRARLIRLVVKGKGFRFKPPVVAQSAGFLPFL